MFNKPQEFLTLESIILHCFEKFDLGIPVIRQYSLEKLKDFIDLNFLFSNLNLDPNNLYNIHIQV